MRGYVTHVRSGATDRPLKDIAGVVGELPVFDRRLLTTLRWAAMHYVAPVSALLGRPAPPNSPRRFPARPMSVEGVPDPGDSALGQALAAGTRIRTQYLVGSGPWVDEIAELARVVLAGGRTMAVVLPTITETERFGAALHGVLGVAPHLVTSHTSAASRTRSWAAAELEPGQLLVGTRELAAWKLGALGLAVVIQEGRPAMTAPQTPTLAVQTLLRHRSRSEGFQLAFAGPVPTTEALAAGVEIVPSRRRPWPLVEIVDRSEEPPGGGLLLDSTVQGIRGVLRRGGHAFVFVTHRGDAAAFRCVACGALRRCERCGAAVSRSDRCQRCDMPLGSCPDCGGERFQALGAALGTVMAELRRRIGAGVTPVGGGGPVTVGSEKDIVDVIACDLAVIVDADGPLLAPHYRAEEDSLRTFARVALTVERGRGKRCLIQTLQPNHRVFGALRAGDPVVALRAMLEERERDRFPPVVELMAIEIGNAPDAANAEIAALVREESVLGPARSGDRLRWLISGPDLQPIKVRLRSLVQTWRDGGARVRIDADPVRL